MKYGIWNCATPEMGAVNALVQGGYAPLTAMILSARGIDGVRAAREYLGCDASLPDPFLMTDMAPAAARAKAVLEGLK